MGARLTNFFPNSKLLIRHAALGTDAPLIQARLLSARAVSAPSTLGGSKTHIA